MNEDTWENLDTSERRDHELISGYLNDAPEEFENESWKLRMKTYDMMAFGGKKWKQLMKCSGWVKRISTIKNNYEDDMKLEPWIFKRMDQDLREILLRSSKVEKDGENHHELLRYSGMKIGKVEPTMKIFQSDLGEGMWQMESILTSHLKRIENNSRKLEESGKILGKDLWVRAHSKETPLKWFKREVAPIELNG